MYQKTDFAINFNKVKIFDFVYKFFPIISKILFFPLFQIYL